jgi:hypothetical protein
MMWWKLRRHAPSLGLLKGARTRYSGSRMREGRIDSNTVMPFALEVRGDISAKYCYRMRTVRSQR